ncbi:hypothetical protein [Croceicoccus marinus]|uniref:Uncharacterized protein n=1 Tax=Croceicoccus marinus TaxID=450378 RepID=A0A7G6W163_9SPHN|nr:hypothetical protein [Croceicoccus marinus]QNE07728.1 hypothetical protein H4O24_20095 [Croceicoccus marinus]
MHNQTAPFAGRHLQHSVFVSPHKADEHRLTVPAVELDCEVAIAGTQSELAEGGICVIGPDAELACARERTATGDPGKTETIMLASAIASAPPSTTMATVFIENGCAGERDATVGSVACDEPPCCGRSSATCPRDELNSS